MSPWTLFGWLLLILFCLLLAAGLSFVGLLRGWPAWLVPALVGGCLAVSVIACLLGKKRKKDAPDAPGQPPTVPAPPVVLPPGKAPRWLLLDFDGLLPHLPSLLEGAGKPLHPGGTGPLLWSTPQAHWIAVDAASTPTDSGETELRPTETGQSPASVPSKTAIPPPASASASSEAADTKANGEPSAWDALLDVLEDRGARRWLAHPAGIVLCVSADRLRSGTSSDTAATLILLRLRDIRPRIGDAPLWLILTGLEKAPGMPRMARALTTEITLERNPLHSPLGWLMPARRFHTPVPAWADAGVRQGMARIAETLDGLVRNADAGTPSPGGPALLLESAFRSLVAPLSAFAAGLGDDLRGIFWTALPTVSEKTAHGGPLFLRRLFQEILPGHVSPFPDAGARGRRVRLACRIGSALLLAAAGGALYRGAEASRELLLGIRRLEDSLPHAATIPALNELALSFQRLERDGSGLVRLYGAPQERLGQLRAAIAAHLALPTPDASGRWLNELMIWAGTRPGVEPIRFRAPDGTVLARVDGAVTGAGRQTAARFLDAMRRLAPDAQAVDHLQLLYDASVFAAWHAAGQCLLDAVRPSGIDPRTLLDTRHVPITPREALGPDDPCAAFLKSAERELRFAEGPIPDWVAALRDLRHIQKLAQLPIGTGETSWTEAVGLIGEPPDAARRALGNVESLFRARAAWTDYRGALAALSSEAGSGEGLVRLARALYGGDVNGGLRATDDAWRMLTAALEARNPGLLNDPLIPSLVRAPLLVAAGSATNEAARNLQERWSSEVVAPVEGLEDEALQQALIGDGGVLNAFTADAAKPFIRPSSAGFAPASALGRTFPLSTAFLRLLAETPQRMALYPASYPVRVSFSPVTVNPKAKAYPRGLSLRMDCANAPVRSDIYNYKEDVLFDWSPEQCGGLTLAFLLDGFEAAARYDGPLGFARFADQALAGPMEFVPSDFPEAAVRLEALGITRIKTRFRIEGGEAVRDRLRALPPALVRNILRGDG